MSRVRVRATYTPYTRLQSPEFGAAHRLENRHRRIERQRPLHANSTSDPLSACARRPRDTQRRSPPRSRAALNARVAGAWLVVTLALPCAIALAQQDASIFRDADLAQGEKLIADNQCNACHIKKFGGDGTSIYRPQGRINTAGFLRGMVEQCNTELKLQLWPEDVTSIAAVLNRDFYRFK